jgi:hypothetical protein
MGDVELRCPSRMHGILKEGLIEVKCRSRFCGSSSFATVLHYFSPATGELVETKRYKEPPIVVKED